ncbi:ApeA N-terminal domain 1-containing protein [Micavibrio aeruginosavorus]|uniref:Uncharacterized protein n=1 Tax=Micavibrio aeruginosavorus EPB TaxID=349215 RepID=M4VL97_9BACT|nr:HEPN domain-containing protein [Micavibrio aeruginosavorus]AGH98886.1 hypothetical protein A11S_2087 [Micavibrio aeruginosavorus EPB]
MHPLKPDEQSKKWIGRFSVQERPDVYGHLFFTADEGIRTELFYDTKEEKTPHIPLNGMIDCISGVTEGSDKVTLINCFEGGSIQRGGLNQFNLHVNYLLWGQHVTDLNKPLFKLFSFSSQSFHAFISPENIRVHHNHKNDRLSVKYVKPRNKIYECENLGTLEIDIGIRQFYLGELSDGSYPLKEEARLEINFKKKKSLNEIIAIAKTLDLFFSITSGKFMAMPRISLGKNDLKELSEGKIHENFADLLLTMDWYKPQEFSHWRDNTLVFYEVSRNWGKIISKLIQESDILIRPMGLYAAATARNLDIETRFLYLIQAIEGFHRRIYETEIISKSDFKESKNNLLATAKKIKSKSAQDLFVRKISGLRNDPSLNQRIQHLFGNLPKEVAFCKPEYAPKIVKIRDTLSHNLESKFDNHAYQECASYSDLLQRLFELSLLKYLGVTNNTLKKIYDRNWKIRYVNKTITEILKEK